VSALFRSPAVKHVGLSFGTIIRQNATHSLVARTQVILIVFDDWPESTAGVACPVVGESAGYVLATRRPPISMVHLLNFVRALFARCRSDIWDSLHQRKCGN